MMQSPLASRSALRYLRQNPQCTLNSRSLTTTPYYRDEASLESSTTTTQPPEILDSTSASTFPGENDIAHQGTTTVGSRRRRAALQTSGNIPFEQLPYQCFQEARKILQVDRASKLKQIETEKLRIANLEARDVVAMGGGIQGVAQKKRRLTGMYKYLNELKVLADANDPVIKRRYEDGLGDMNRPIYRNLAEKKWRKYKRLVLMQRLEQLHVIPDVLPHIDPTADITISYGRNTIQPGVFLSSQLTEQPPKLSVQLFEAGDRLVTIAVIDADVPDVEKDGYDYRCHFLASNIPLSPTTPSILLSKLENGHIILPWMPPHAQKGSKYHRLTIFVMEQGEQQPIDIDAARTKAQRLGFNLRSFNDRHRIVPITATLFRNIWDESTTDVMERAGIEGANIELKPNKPEKLPYKKKDGARYR